VGGVVAVAPRVERAVEDARTVLTPKGRRTRAHLLDVAGGLFARSGYDATSVSDIVRAAEVSRGAFYLYFASKAALLEALVGELGAELATVTERLDGAGPSLDGTRRGLDAYLTFYERHGRVLVELDSVGSAGAALGAVAGSVRRELTAAVERLVRARGAGGADPRYAATALLSMAERFAFVWLVLGEEFDRGRAVDTLAVLWQQALGPPRRQTT